MRKIVRLLIHVLSHVYRCHWAHLVDLQLHPHFNTVVYHVMLFAKQFALVDPAAKDSSRDVLEALFERLRHRHSGKDCSDTPTTSRESDTQQLHSDVQSQP